MTTVFDGSRTVWMFEFATQAEQTVTAAAANLQQYANASVLAIKAMAGQTWESRWDTAPAALSGLSVLTAAIAEGAAAGITVVPWVEATGPQDAPSHVALGKTLVVDLEQPPDFWQADPAQIAGYLQALRDNGVENLFVSIDPRPQAVQWIRLADWHGLVAGILPQVYWTSFQRPWMECVGYVQALLAYGQPVYPVLPFDAQPSDLAGFWQAALALGCTAPQLWRLGSADGAELTAFGQLAVKRQAVLPTNDDLVQVERFLLETPPAIAKAVTYLQPFL